MLLWIRRSSVLTVERARACNSERGIALTLIVFVSAILMTIVGAGLLFSGMELKRSSHHKIGSTALHIADTGVQHALAVIPAGSSFSYASSTEIVPWTVHPTLTEFRYRVVAVNAAGGSQAILTATTEGPNSTSKVVVAYVGRGGYGLGATSLPGSMAPNTETNFSGTSFSINGNDNCNAVG
jgi:hypothetical protein